MQVNLNLSNENIRVSLNILPCVPTAVLEPEDQGYLGVHYKESEEKGMFLKIEENYANRKGRVLLQKNL